MEKQTLKVQEVINDVRPHARLEGVSEVVCESGAIYLTKKPENYKVGNAVVVEYVEIRKPKKNGSGEWVNLWTQDKREYDPRKSVSIVNEGKLLEEIHSKVNDIWLAVKAKQGK